MATIAELQAELQKSREENLALKAKVEAKNKKSCKVTDKGGVSVYGLGRFPVTLYPEQWDALASYIPDVIKFKDEAVKAGKLVQSKEANVAMQAAKAPKAS